MRCARPLTPRTSKARMRSGSRWSPTATVLVAPLAAALVVEPSSRLAAKQQHCCTSESMANSASNPYAHWLERYRRAWIERDAAAASRLFTDDATYREQPFQAPFVGRAAIRDYWAKVTASQTSVELRYGQPIVDGNRLAVEWWANLQTTDGPITLAGEFLL